MEKEKEQNVIKVIKGTKNNKIIDYLYKNNILSTAVLTQNIRCTIIPNTKIITRVFKKLVTSM
jgi:hypothetical protein